MKDFRQLLVWDRAHRFTLSVYSATRSFPKEEQYGLTNQLRRAASSIPTNIAEGCGKSSNADFNRYLQIAFGSANETEYHLLLARDLQILQHPIYADLQADLIEIKKMLAALISKVRTDG
jgi:four helix bundle protein